MQELLSNVQASASNEREAKVIEQRSLKQRLHHTERELDAVTVIMKDRIGSVVETVEKKVMFIERDSRRR